jgi:hypothetical protein
VVIILIPQFLCAESTMFFAILPIYIFLSGLSRYAAERLAGCRLSRRYVSSPDLLEWRHYCCSVHRAFSLTDKVRILIKNQKFHGLRCIVPY